MTGTFSRNLRFLGQLGSLQFHAKLSIRSIPHTPEESKSVMSKIGRTCLLPSLAMNCSASSAFRLIMCRRCRVHFMLRTVSSRSSSLIGFIRPAEGLSPRSGPGNYSPKLGSAIRLLGFYRNGTFTRKLDTAYLDATCADYSTGAEVFRLTSECHFHRE